MNTLNLSDVRAIECGVAPVAVTARTRPMSRWHGYLPLASLALTPVLERAARTGTQFSAAERALFTACEFWVAVEGRTVAAYLGAEAEEPLRYLGIVYSALETPGVARALVRAVGEFKDATTARLRLQCGYAPGALAQHHGSR